MINTTRSSRLKVKISEVDFKAIIAQAITNLRNLEGAHRIEIKTTIEGYIPFYSDADQLAVIFSNLISNSIKFQHVHEAHPRLEMHIEIDKNKGVFTFKDNGIGIPKENLTKVFDMFFRAPGNAADGSGLGLYIVKEIVRKMKGKIFADSVVSEGSKFVIELPNKIDPDLFRKLEQLMQNSK